MPAPAVVRFAPSPTGPPHLGNLRTALFNWLYARATGGRFIVRVDDTDRERLDPQAEAAMLEALRWLGFDWDEGPEVGGPHAPYRQSERLANYHAAAERLIADGHVYRCTCAAERLAEVQARLRTRVYDGHCRDLGIGPTDAPHVVRLKTPLTGSVDFHDLIYGGRRFGWDKLAGDVVLVKSDGWPTYHLATVVDDMAMGVTHVIRGEEWIPSTPIHLLLFEALGGSAPAFAHLSLVTNKGGKKLKKRDPSFEFTTYRDGGALPAALVNALALLGWHPGTTDEVFGPEELVSRFSLDRVSKSPAAFDEDKLRWLNRQHIARLSEDELADLLIPRIRAAYPEAAARDERWLRRLAVLLREEIGTLNDAVPAARFAFEVGPMSAEARAALASEQAEPTLQAALRQIAALSAFDIESVGAALKDLRAGFKESHGWGGGAVMMPLRVALTGATAGPHLADVIDLLGKAETLDRIHQAMAIIER